MHNRAAQFLELEPLIKHDPKYFMMLHCASAIRETNLEGGDAKCALAYYQQLLLLSEHVLPLGISHEALATARAIIDDLIYFYHLYPIASSAEIIEKISLCCKTRGACYLPSGYVGKKMGHFAVLKITALADGRYACSMLDQGDGMSFHRLIVFKGNQAKRDYQSREYAINLHNALGLEFIEKIKQLCVDNRIYAETDINGQMHSKNNLMPYGKEDLYGALECYGEKLPSNSTRMKDKAVTPQRSGTCTITNIKCSVRDALLMLENLPLPTIKRFHFILKQSSLIEGYKAYLRGKEKLQHLELALNEYYVRICKHYPEVLSDEDLQISVEIGEVIKQRLANDKAKMIQEKCLSQPLPPLQCEWNLSAHPLVVPSSTTSSSAVTVKADIKAGTKLDIQGCKVEDIVAYLDQAIQYFTNRNDKLGLMELRRFMHSLAVPSGNKKDLYWDRLDEFTSKKVIAQLAQLVRYQTSLHLCGSLYKFEIALIAYDIAAQLAPRLSELKLSGTVYALTLDDVFSEKKFYFDAESYHTIKQVVEHFKQRNMGKKPILGNALGFDPEDATKTYLLSTLLDPNKRDAIIDYLKDKEMMENTELDINDSKLISLFLSRIPDQDQGFPGEDFIGDSFYHLLVLSGTAHAYGELREFYRQDERLRLDMPADRYVFKEGKYHWQKYFNESGLSSNPFCRNFPEDVQASNALVLHADFAENTIYHPIASLHALRQSEGRHNEMYKPYEINVAGTFTLGCSWGHYPPGGANKAEELDEDLRSIECAPSLQVQNALEWMQENMSDLIYSDVRQRLFSLLFGYGKLDQALIFAPHDVVALIIHILRMAFDFYRQPENVFFWLCDIQMQLRQYVGIHAALHKLNVSGMAWPDLNVRDLLKAKLKEMPKVNDDFMQELRCNFAQRIMLTYKDAKELTIDDVMTLMKCRNILQSYKKLFKWNDEVTSLIAEYVWMQHREAVNTIFFSGENDVINAYANYMLADCINLPCAYVWQRQGDCLYSTEMGYVIDIMQANITRYGQDVHNMAHILRSNSSAILSRLGLNKESVVLLQDSAKIEPDFQDEISQKLITADNQYEFYCKFGHIIQVYRQVKIAETCKRLQLYYSAENPNSSDARIYFQANKIDDPFNGNNYNYWSCLDDASMIFVEQCGNPGIAFLGSPKLGWMQLKKISSEWYYTNEILLNLNQPMTELESQWKQRLEHSIGTAGIRMRAVISGSQCQLVEMELSHLHLKFICCNNKLESYDFPGFVLSEQKSIEALNGLQTLIILEDVNNVKKYLLPAYKLKIISGSATLRTEDFFDFMQVLPARYYTYEYSRDGSLRGNSLEADLYLATIYRAQGDYMRAMQSLERTLHYANNTEALSKIVQQLEYYQDLSSLGAAFDCKIICRMYKHMQKWSKQPDEWFKYGIVPSLVKHAMRQYEYYKNTTSAYKESINIIPEYLRLTVDDESAIKFIEQIIKSKVPKNELPDVVLMHHANFKAKRIEALGQCAWYPNPSDLVDYLSLRNILINFSFTDVVQDTFRPSFLRIFPTFETSKPALSYLKKYYVDMYVDAISNNPEVVKRLQVELFYLLQNDTDITSEHYILIASLLTVTDMPFAFANLRIFDNSLDCFNAVKRRYCDIWDQANTANQKITLQFLSNTQEKVKVIKETALDNPLPAPKQLVFAIAPMQRMHEAKHPLQHLLAKYFIKTHESVAREPFPLNEAVLANATPLAKSILMRYCEGHRDNLRKHRPIYKFNTEINLRDFITALHTQKLNDVAELNQKKLDLLAVANRLPENLVLRALMQASRGGAQRPALGLNDLIQALLKQDVTELAQRNPFLTQEDVANLMSQFCDYAVLQSRIDQIEDALQIVGKKQEIAGLTNYEIQTLGTVIDKERHPDFAYYPAFLMYEFLAKRMLRMDQATALIKLISLIEGDNALDIEWRHGLLQFAAGGGKTALLIPILAYHFARKGFLPCIFNTNELYSIGVQDIPESLRASLQQNMEVIERELEHQWTQEEFENLYADLETWRLQGKCLLIKSITWHSINTALRIARIERKEDLADSAERVLEFFAEKTVKLEDESHLISDPLQESIKTYGPRQAVAVEWQQLFVRFYDCLMGRVVSCQPIVNLAGLIDEGKKEVSAENLARIQSLLAKQMCHEPCFSGLNPEALFAYWLQFLRHRPDWLKQLHRLQPALADLIVLARAFIQTHLPHILSLQYAKDFGASIHYKDLTAAPKHDGRDTTAHFSDAMLVMALTIQLYENKGALPVYVLQILGKLLAMHKRERLWNKDTTEAEMILNQLLPESHPYVLLDALTSHDMDQLSKDAAVCKNPAMVKEFLYQYALPQITTPKYRVSSTPADLQAGFKRSIMFSATPGLRETYPVFLKAHHCFYENAFEAQVIAKLFEPQNSAACLLEMTDSPQAFFTQFKTQYPELSAQLTGLIDRGALLANSASETVISAFLDSIDANDLRKIAAGFDAQGMMLQSRHPQVKNMRIEGTKLNEALARQGLKATDLLIFLFLDLSKTTGTDVKRPYKDRVGLTVGKGQTVTEIIQAAMRERQLLCDDAQSVVWLMFKALYQEVDPNTTQVDLSRIFYWMINNEGAETETKVIMRAYQGIAQQIEAIMWKKVRDKERPAYYLERLQKSASLVPYETYEIESKMDAAAIVCRDYAIELCSHYSLDYTSLPAKTAQNIHVIIQETAVLINKMRKPHGTELNATVCQEQQALVENIQEVKEEQKMKTLYDMQTDIRYNLEKYGEQDYLDNIFKPNKNYQALLLEHCGHVHVPEIVLNKQHFSPLADKSAQRNIYVTWLKPIHHFVVKIHRAGTYEFIACTRAGAEFFQHEIQRLEVLGDPNCYAIIGKNAHILASSKTFSPEQKQTLLQSEQLMEMIHFAAFLNGRIKNPVIMSQIVRKYGWNQSDYQCLVNAIMRIHVSRHAIKLLNLPKFEQLCGWQCPVEVAKLPPHTKQKINLDSIPTMRLEPVTHYPVRVAQLPSMTAPQSVLPPVLFGKQPLVRAPLSKVELHQLAEKKKRKRIRELLTHANYTTAAIHELYDLAPPAMRFSAFPGKNDCFMLYEIMEKQINTVSGHYQRKIVYNRKVLYVATGGELRVHRLEEASEENYRWDKPLAEDAARYLVVAPPPAPTIAAAAAASVAAAPLLAQHPAALFCVPTMHAKTVTAAKVSQLLAEYERRKKTEGYKIPNLKTQKLIRQLRAANSERDRYDLLANYVHAIQTAGKTQKTLYRVIMEDAELSKLFPSIICAAPGRK